MNLETVDLVQDLLAVGNNTVVGEEGNPIAGTYVRCYAVLCSVVRTDVAMCVCVLLYHHH